MKAGRVYIAGAGPGDEALLTRRCFQLIQEADVIVYDRLGAKRFLGYARDDCEKIDAGKGPDKHTLKQPQIHRVLMEKAKEGKKVLRLKGGDPFIFGRGAEEAEILEEAGIPYEVIPGISSFYSACAYAGIPITKRGVSSSFHVFTGHTEQGRELDYKKIATSNGTIVFLMAMQNIEMICNNLIMEGKSWDTPVAVIQWGTQWNQQVVEGCLQNIASLCRENEVENPAIIVIGEVVTTRKSIDWQKFRPLWGKRILLTSGGSAGRRAASFLQEEGAEVVTLPVMKISYEENSLELKKAIQRIQDYTWIFFTSERAVKGFFHVLKQQKKDIRCLYGIKIMCIGLKTKESLEEIGIFSDWIPKEYHSVQCAREMGQYIDKKDMILFPSSELAGNGLEQTALSLGASFHRVTLYRNGINECVDQEFIKEIEEGQFDAIGFFSSSQVEYLWQLTGGKLGKIPLCSIGPATSEAMRQKKMNPSGEADACTGLGLAKGIKNLLCQNNDF